MHLVQGDRCFSPRKGSIVDSVIGVFVTQNVSNHLSSSAFMSLAAQFPPKSNNDTPCFEEATTWHEKKSNQPGYQGSSFTIHGMGSNIEKEVTYHGELLGSSNSGVSWLLAKLCRLVNRSKRSPETRSNPKSLVGTSYLELLQRLTSHALDNHKTGNSSLQENSEGDLETRSNPKSLVCTSYVELLQRVTSHALDNHKIGNSSSCKENGLTDMECSECHVQNLNKERSNNPNTSIEPIICSCNDHFQMVSDASVLETESLGMLTEENLFSSAKNKENWVSEQRGETAESVNQAAVQNNMSASFQEAQKSPSEDNDDCSNLHEKFYKAFLLHNRQVGNTMDNIQSDVQERTHRMHRALKAQNLSRDLGYYR
ncbi:hypothetical protein Vadar_030600 [Vaccinium darrowii]|uniref:Uncharacterized protein n=1 Tax=Vaccinium darrowii TaxID=229202 RepID=A0ACB7YZZ8_9ERIC|nr:hypothetical protein Vadar_030600 [Vaccinium darrowii]